MRKVEVSDVTLKTYAQGATKDLSFREKLFVANSLAKAGVDVIELPACHNKKEDVIVNRTIAESVLGTVIAIDAGITEEEIAFAYESIKSAKNKRLQIALPVSVVQMEYFYHAKSPKMLENIDKAVKCASTFDAEVEFIMKDATRAEDGFILKAVETAVNSGAKIITLCDDEGEGYSDVFVLAIKEIKENFDVKVLVMPSDKIKMSPAIAIESIIAGADGVKTSTTGEYLPLSVFVDAIRFKGESIGVKTNIDYTLAKETIKGISEENGNAEKEVKVGGAGSIILDQNATAKDITEMIKRLGYDLSISDAGKVYEEFARVSAKKGAIGERELEAIIASTAMQVPSTFHLVSYVVNSSNVISTTANITLEKDGKQMSGVSTGDGPIDASFQAIEHIIGHHYELDDLNVQAVTKGREAVGSAIVRLRAGGKIYSGNGVSTDIVGACIRAFVNALNKIVYSQSKQVEK